MTIQRVKIDAYERGLVFEGGTLIKVLDKGAHWIVNPLTKYTIEIVSILDNELKHKNLDLIIKSGLLANALTIVEVKQYQRGIVWIDGELVAIEKKGVYAFWNVLKEVSFQVVSMKDMWFNHTDLKLVLASRALDSELTVIDVQDNERALVWIDNKFETILGQGKHALWNVVRSVRFEIVDISESVFEHKDFDVIVARSQVTPFLTLFDISAESEGLYFKDGEFQKVLTPGRYAFWKTDVKITVIEQDMREEIVDISGQDIMTKDKVTLRINAVINYRIIDLLKRVQTTRNLEQAIYREAQLALRAVVGTRSLDELLTEKDSVVSEMESVIRTKVEAFGTKLISSGIRDIILPGEMKDILNKVTEAQKAAEANQVSRREEVAAIRSQANTAKILENSPVLMRLKELETIERIASASKLNLVIGDKGITESLTTMI